MLNSLDKSQKEPNTISLDATQMPRLPLRSIGVKLSFGVAGSPMLWRGMTWHDVRLELSGDRWVFPPSTGSEKPSVLTSKFGQFCYTVWAWQIRESRESFTVSSITVSPIVGIEATTYHEDMEEGPIEMAMPTWENIGSLQIGKSPDSSAVQQKLSVSEYNWVQRLFLHHPFYTS